MKDHFIRFGKVGILILCSAFMLSFAPVGNEKIVSDLVLKNVDGKIISLAEYPQAKGFMIVFICNHCPFAKLYPSRMNELNSKFLSLGVPLIAISSTDTSVYEDDGFDKMVEKSLSEKFNFPYLYDCEQRVAKDFSAQRTPHAFLIWKENGKWVIKYSGAIDDNGAESEKIKHHYLADAVNALLNGEDVKIHTTKSIGCQIHFRK